MTTTRHRPPQAGGMVASLRWRALALLLPLAGIPALAAAASIHPVAEPLCKLMQQQHILPATSPLTCKQLSVVAFSYVDFQGRVKHDGQIMVMAAAAPQVREIFDTLLARRFPLARGRLIHHYQGNDAASMHDNNTSGFNHRLIKDGNQPSLHAYGLAIDLNPVQNPVIYRAADGKTVIEPAAGQRYQRRPAMGAADGDHHGMAEQVVDIFAHHGFTYWGGDWREPVDFQHFQVSRRLAEKMAASSVVQAQALFAQMITRYRHCRAHYQGPAVASRRHCARQSE